MTVSVLIAGLASYLVGGIPFSYIAGRMARGIDLREHGSGNLGASNTYRILGGKIALAVLVLDVAKGLVPVLVAGRFDTPGAAPLHALAAAAGAITGHLFSPYLRFSGGKGIATSAGSFAGLAPLAFAGALAVFATVFAARRIVSLASLSAAVALPLAVWLLARTGLAPSHASVLWVTVLVMLAVIVKHRGNIRRLAAGTEPALSRRREEHS
ncbi:MAG TPA: glycerol-3-phosphate 1-O-acyltransferase PlsY [Candidatus Krumholzibacteria bacterium]|nr:glycerol-3-phosphate 1-O-acyltransferase PlsY [Candidatus Krumholzibacteria bacterium]